MVDGKPFVLELADGRQVLVDPEHAVLISRTGILSYGDALTVCGTAGSERGGSLGDPSGYRDGSHEVLRGTVDVPLLLEVA